MSANDKRSPEAEAYRRLYKDNRWRGKHGIRAKRLSADPLCRMCQKAGRITVATVVDHIVEHKGDPALFFDFNNTQSLCDHPRYRCHSSTKQQMERRGYSSAVGEDGWPTDPYHPTNDSPRQ